MTLQRLFIFALVIGVFAGYVAEPYLRPFAFPRHEHAVAGKKKKHHPKKHKKTDKPTKRREVDIFDIGEITDGVDDVSEEERHDFSEADEERLANEELPEDAMLRRYKRFLGEGDGDAPVQEPIFKGKWSVGNWKNPKILKRQLAMRIRSRIGKMDEAGIADFLKNPENRLNVTQWELLHRADLEALTRLMRDPDTCKDLTPLLNDLQWVSFFVYDNEMEKPEVVLAMLRHFRQVDGRMDYDVLEDGTAGAVGLKRRVAGAIATQFVRYGWYGDDRVLSQKEVLEMKEIGIILPKLEGRAKKDPYRLARERYLFFAESINAGLLNGGFGRLPGWLIHYVVGWKGDSPFGTASTMRWLRDNTAAPAEAYMGMAFQVPYLPTNTFGDSIFSSFYYQPFTCLYPGNFAKMTRDVGAVCGGVSHFGASSACANGVPAMTMGEPGHCAYAVYHDGKWRPTNSVFDEHHPHWKHWGEFGSWSALNMQTAMYQDGQRTRDAQMICSIASMLAEHKNTVASLKCYEMSMSLQPLNRPVMDFYIDTAVARLRRNYRKWLEINRFACSALASRHPEMCAKLLIGKIYPVLLPLMRSDKLKMQLFRDYYNNLDKDGDAPWEMVPLLEMQYRSLGRVPACKREFLQMVIDTAGKKPDFARAVTWVVRTAMENNKRFGNEILAMVDEAAKTSPDKELLDAAVIRAGEELRDRELVYRYGASYASRGAENMPNIPPTQGNLISARGYVAILKEPPGDLRSYSQHLSALSEKGGCISSGIDGGQGVLVVLPKPSRIGTIVIVPEGSTQDYKSWSLEVSLDGENWHKLLDLPDEVDKPYLHITFKTKRQNARYVRVMAKKISFRALLIYDDRKRKE